MNMCDLTNKAEMDSLEAEIQELRCHIEYLISENDNQRKRIEAAEKMESEIKDLRANLRDAANQNEVMRSQLDIVYLIFGNR